MLEKINSKRFEKEIISTQNQHQFRGGAQTQLSIWNSHYCVTTCAVWEDCGTKTDSTNDAILPVTNSSS